MGTTAYQQYPVSLGSGDFTNDWRVVVHDTAGTGEGTVTISVLGSKLAVETIEEVTTTSYTLVLADANKQKEFNNASAISIEIPLNTSVAFDVGTAIGGVQTGAGQVMISGAVGVTIRNSDLKTLRQYSRFTMLKVGTDTWDVFGELTS